MMIEIRTATYCGKPELDGQRSSLYDKTLLIASLPLNRCRSRGEPPSRGYRKSALGPARRWRGKNEDATRSRGHEIVSLPSGVQTLGDVDEPRSALDGVRNVGPSRERAVEIDELHAVVLRDRP